MKKIIYLLSVLFLFACNEKSEEVSIRQIKVSLTNTSDRAAYSHSTVIILETNENCLLENVVKVKSSNDGIYLLSSYGGNIYKFSKEGQFLWKLSKGEGPRDLVFPTDFYYSDVDDCLYVLDNYRTIKQYLSNGNYVKETKVDTPSFLFEKLGNKSMMFNPNLTTNSNCYLNVYENDVLNFKGLPIEKKAKKVSFMPSNVFVRSEENGMYYIQHMLSDTIYTYKMQSDEIRPAFYIDTDKKTVNSLDTEFNDTRSYYQISEREGLIAGVAGLSFLNEKLYLMMYYHNKPWYIVHDLKNESTMTTNSLCDGIPNSLRCVGREKDYVVYSYWPEELFEKEDELCDEVKEQLRRVDKDDNPILILLN